MNATEAAFGVAEVVDENMANAARVHAVENGEDLSEYTMIAFGGAAPLHASRLCEKLGIDRLLVPPGAGVGSAIGFLRAPFSFEANRSVYMKLSEFDPERIKTLLSELKQEAVSFVRNCDAESKILANFKVYMRYTGQGWEIPITLSEQEAMNPDRETFLTLFEKDYSKLFGRTVHGMNVEITVWAVNATTPTKPVPVVPVSEGDRIADISGNRQIFDPALGKTVEAAIVDRFEMAKGAKAEGPVAIVEDETTIIIPSSRSAVRQVDGCIDIMAKI